MLNSFAFQLAGPFSVSGFQIHAYSILCSSCCNAVVVIENSISLKLTAVKGIIVHYIPQGDTLGSSLASLHAISISSAASFCCRIGEISFCTAYYCMHMTARTSVLPLAMKSSSSLSRSATVLAGRSLVGRPDPLPRGAAADPLPRTGGVPLPRVFSLRTPLSRFGLLSRLFAAGAGCLEGRR